MNYKNKALLIKNRAKLENLINNNEPYDKILKQSKKLDKYIYIEMKDINKRTN